MTKARFASLPIASIEILDRFRLFSAAHAEKLKLSFTDFGRTTPIIVRPHPSSADRYILVAGMHRLDGARQAGKSEIDAEIRDMTDDEARRVEIAENAYRYDLSALDRMRSFAELAELWEKEHTKNPGGRPSKDDKKNSGQVGQGFVHRFSEEARLLTGISERAIRRDIAIARALDPQAVKLLANTALLNNQAQLQRLAREAHATQRAIAKAIAKGEAHTVAQARVHLKLDAPVERNPDDAKLQRLIELFERAPGKVQKRFLKHIGATIVDDARKAA